VPGVVFAVVRLTSGFEMNATARFGALAEEAGGILRTLSTMERAGLRFETSKHRPAICNIPAKILVFMQLHFGNRCSVYLPVQEAGMARIMILWILFTADEFFNIENIETSCHIALLCISY
jgi:hypothetical protein